LHAIAERGKITIVAQIGVELVKQSFDHSRLRQLLAIKPDRLGIRHRVFNTKIKKTHERKPVAYLILDLFIGQIVELLQNEYLEHQHLIPRRTPGIGLALLIRLAPECP
jgi:hypothetical protein